MQFRETQKLTQPGDVRYQAAWDPEDGTVTVVRDLYAGVSGPAGSYPAPTVEDAAAALFAAGFVVLGDWEQAASGSHWAPITRAR